jgi:hypothetical protein
MRPTARADQPRTGAGRLWLLLGIVLANYAAQVPYALHQYGLRFEPRGLALLAATLAWFLVGFVLLLARRAAGFWLLVAYLALDCVFYFHNGSLLIQEGFGIPYHLARFDDPLLWGVFFVGDVNVVAAAYFLPYLLTHRRRFVTP